MCNLLNPRRIDLGGGGIEYSDDLLAIVRGVVHRGIAGALVPGIERALNGIVRPQRG